MATQVPENVVLGQMHHSLSFQLVVVPGHTKQTLLKQCLVSQTSLIISKLGVPVATHKSPQTAPNPPTLYPLNSLHPLLFLPLSSSLEHASKLHSVALIYILFSTCIRGTLARIQIPYRHRHPSPTCLVRMAPTITDGSSVSSYIFNYLAQHTII